MWMVRVFSVTRRSSQRWTTARGENEQNEHTASLANHHFSEGSTQVMRVQAVVTVSSVIKTDVQYRASFEEDAVLFLKCKILTSALTHLPH